MVEISIFQNLIDLQVEEIFKRIEHSDNPEHRAHEADYAWFQLFGMRKIIALGGALHFSLQGNSGSEGQNEYQGIMATLDNALKKAESIYEEIHKDPSTSVGMQSGSNDASA